MSHNEPQPQSGNGQVSTLPDPEVVPQAERRRILQEAEACTQPGEVVGTLLRREGLYSSHLTTRRQQRRRGELQGLTPAQRGRKADPQAAKIARLQHENERVKAQLERVELTIDVQKNFRRYSTCRRPRATSRHTAAE